MNGTKLNKKIKKQDQITNKMKEKTKTKLNKNKVKKSMDLKNIHFTTKKILETCFIYFSFYTFTVQVNYRYKL